MQQQRPAAVTVIAILGFVFGGLGVLGSCYSFGSSLIAGFALQANTKAVPNFPVFGIVTGLLGLVANGVLIIAGTGLLKLQSWARWSNVVYAIYLILTHIFELIFSIVVMKPAMDKWVAANGDALGPFGNMLSTIAMVSAIGGALLAFAFAAAILIVMFLPNVTAAFAGQAPALLTDPDEGWGSPS